MASLTESIQGERALSTLAEYSSKLLSGFSRVLYDCPELDDSRSDHIQSFGQIVRAT